MNSGISSIRSVEWDEVCPWLILFRTFRIARSGRCLIFATVGMVLTGAVTWALSASEKDSPSCPVVESVADIPDSPREVVSLLFPVPARDDGPSEESPVWRRAGFVAVWHSLSEPFIRLFDRSGTWAEAGRSLLRGLLTLAVWAFFGAAITRTAALRLTQDERTTWGQTLRFCRRRWVHYFFAPLCPLIPVFVFALVMVPGGWAMRIGAGAVVVGLFWPLALLGGVASAFLVLGTLAGWPLMWGTVSTEGTDSFDAMSRSYSYVYQRPLHYFFYALVALIFGWLCFLAVLLFASFVIELSTWAISWGAGELIAGALLPGAETQTSGPEGAGIGIVRFWIVGVKLVALSFAYSYFWVASSAIYLLLRRDTDAKEMDEVFLEGGVLQVAAGLPDLTLDEAGAPVLEDGPHESSDSAEEPPEAPKDES